MTNPTFFLTAILVLAFAIQAIGQEPPKPILVDEFANIPCGDLQGRLDVFLQEINRKDGSVGYIVISSDPKQSSRGKVREKFIDGYPRFRQFSENRIKVFRATLSPPLHAQMWLVPFGADFSIQPLPDEEYKITATRRKFVFYSESGEIGACYTGPPFRLLARYLKVNRDYSANIAIGSTSSSSFRESKAETAKLFTNNYGIDRKRLRFFRVRTTDNDWPIYDLWLVRRKSK